jgi:hypothetical protein
MSAAHNPHGPQGRGYIGQLEEETNAVATGLWPVTPLALALNHPSPSACAPAPASASASPAKWALGSAPAEESTSD